MTIAYNNSTFIDFSTLIQVHGGIFIDENPRLRNLAFPALQTVNGLFQVAGNAQLQSINLPSLMQGGALDFTGNFSRHVPPWLNACHKLTSSSVNVSKDLAITSYANVQSSNTYLNCTPINQILQDKAEIDCSIVTNPQPELAINISLVSPIVLSGFPSSSSSNSQYPSPTTSSASTNRSSSPTALSTHAQIGIGIGLGLGVILLILVFAIIVFRRRRSQPPDPHYATTFPAHEEPFLELSSGMNHAQLDSNPHVCELLTDKHHVQLEAPEQAHQLSNGRCEELPELSGQGMVELVEKEG